MFRISRTDHRSVVKLTIDGRLVKEHIAVAKQCCEEVLETGRTLHLILGDVDTIDETGRLWLLGLIRRGISVVGRNLYVSYVVSGLKRIGACARLPVPEVHPHR